MLSKDNHITANTVTATTTANVGDSNVLSVVVDVIKDLGRVQDSQSATTDLTTTLGLPEGNLDLGFKFVASSLVVIDAVAACTFGYKTTNRHRGAGGKGSAQCLHSSSISQQQYSPRAPWLQNMEISGETEEGEAGEGGGEGGERWWEEAERERRGEERGQEERGKREEGRG